MKKLIVIIGLLISLSVLLCACSKSDTTSGEVPTNLSEIGKNILENVTMQPMVEMEYEYFSTSYLSDEFDDSIIEESALYEADDPLFVDTIILLKLSSKDSMDSVKTILESIQQEKMNANANGYNPTQYEIASSGEIKQNGNTIYLVISEKKDEIITIINSYFK